MTRHRGEARAHSPTRCTIGKTIYFVGDTLLGDNGMVGFFRPKMRNEMDGFYPKWANVPIENKNRIWELLLKEWNLGEYNRDSVYNKFMAQNGVKYRKFLSELKLKQIKENNVKDVFELLDKPKPTFMKSTKIWRKYMRHWSSTKHRNKSAINAKNRGSKQGCNHGYGRKSAAARLREMGKKPSQLAIMITVNQKRDAKNNPTGEVHHQELQVAIALHLSK